jgi:16S rRNA (guanine1207-N2)-methyltransferase
LAGSEGPFELILLNPPFHDGGAVGDHIALRLFRQAAQRLAPGGRLLLVGNRHLGYHRSLRRWFSRVRQLDADPKFVVFEAGRS